MEEKVSSFSWREEIEKYNGESIDEDFILFEEPILLSTFDYPIKLDATVAINCIQGTFKWKVNLKQFHEKGPFTFVIMAGQVLQYEYFSDDFKGYFFVMSDRFLENLFMNQQESAGLFLSVKDNPLFYLNEDDLHTLINYCNMIKSTIKMVDNPNRIEIVKHLNLALYYKTSYQFHRKPDVIKTKNDILVKKFLDIVGVHFREERAMEFYAKRLLLTPKYLSKVIKETSGKSGNDWINNYVILEAKALLNSTNLTIQQISDKLNFPTQSYFGRYFKRYAGMSPKEYRNSR